MNRLTGMIDSLGILPPNRRLRRHLLASKAPLVFVHVPKTAGTTFRREILMPAFRRREIYLIYDSIRFHKVGSWEELAASPKSFRTKLRLVTGHMPFDVDEILPNPRYMTFLREPVERAISDYYYCRQDPGSAVHEAANELDLVEFCRRGLSQTRNCQARHLSNKVFGADYASDEAMLAAAKANLDRCFFFGLTERFAESVELFYRKIGYRGPTGRLPVRNRSRRPRAIPEEVRAELARCNALDLELYAHARARFEADLRDGAEAPAAPAD